MTGLANDVIIGDGAAASGNSIIVTGGTFSSQAALVVGRMGTGNSFSATAAATVSNDNVRFDSGNTIVTAGTLALFSATNNIASSPTIQVGAGSTLDVSAVSSGFALASPQTLAGEGGVVGGVTASAGSTIAPGGSGVGTLTFSSSLGLFGVLDIDLSCASTDLASVGGALTLDPASTVSFSVGNPLTEPAYVFADYGSLAGTFGTVSNLPAGYLLDYNYLGGNQLALVTVPEPSAVALVAVGCIAAVATARWRRKGNRPL